MFCDTGADKSYKANASFIERRPTFISRPFQFQSCTQSSFNIHDIDELLHNPYCTDPSLEPLRIKLRHASTNEEEECVPGTLARSSVWTTDGNAFIVLFRECPIWKYEEVICACIKHLLGEPLDQPIVLDESYQAIKMVEDCVFFYENDLSVKS